MENNNLLMIILAFVVGFMLQGMMKNMCGGRLVEGSFNPTICWDTSGHENENTTQSDADKSCTDSSDCKPFLTSPTLGDAGTCNEAVCKFGVFGSLFDGTCVSNKDSD